MRVWPCWGAPPAVSASCPRNGRTSRAPCPRNGYLSGAVSGAVSAPTRLWAAAGPAPPPPPPTHRRPLYRHHVTTYQPPRAGPGRRSGAYLKEDGERQRRPAQPAVRPGEEPAASSPPRRAPSPADLSRPQLSALPGASALLRNRRARDLRDYS